MSKRNKELPAFRKLQARGALFMIDEMITGSRRHLGGVQTISDIELNLSNGKALNGRPKEFLIRRPSEPVTRAFNSAHAS